MSEEPLINVSVSDNALLNIHLPDTPPSVDKAIENLSAPASYWGGLLGGSFTKAIYASIGLPCEAWANKKILQFKAASEAMQKRISAIPPENRIEPSFGVVRSISDGLELCIDEETLREGFVNLLGSAMDSRKLFKTPLQFRLARISNCHTGQIAVTTLLKGTFEVLPQEPQTGY